MAARTTRPRGATAIRLIAAGTMLRIVLAPVIMALIFAGEDLEVVAAIAFTLVAATDYVDGFLARRWSITTTLGSFLDTTADKLLVTFVLLALLAEGRASPWVVAIIVGRELVLLGLRAVAAADGTVMKPSPWGKRKTAVQFIAILLAILRPGDPIGGAFIDEWAMAIAAAITVISAVEYFVHQWPALKEGT